MTRFRIVLSLVLLFLSYGIAESNEYQLNKGETLYSISRKLGIPLDLLVSLNGIEDVTRIKAGTKLVIPRIHVVKRGETLYGISRKFHVKLEDILKLNKIGRNYTIKPGEKLFIPPPEKISPGGISHPAKELEKEKKSAVWKIAKNTRGVYWPVEGRMQRINGKIVGVKIRGKTGSKILSVSSGRVIWSNPYKGYGEVIFIESKSGYIYGYLGNNRVLVKVGEVVSRGSQIGILGDGEGEFSSLLFIVYKDGKPMDVFKAPRM